MRLHQRLLVGAALLGGSVLASAGIILQDQSDATRVISFYSQIGQSFQAEDAQVKVGVYLSEMNPGRGATSVDVALWSGDGFAGTKLATVTVGGLSSFLSGWIDADFSSLTLTAGSTYTLELIEPIGQFGLQRWASGSLYSGGTAFHFGTASLDTDLRFRVVPVGANPVPEPASLALVAGGLLGLVETGRRRRR